MRSQRPWFQRARLANVGLPDCREHLCVQLDWGQRDANHFLPRGAALLQPAPDRTSTGQSAELRITFSAPVQ